MARGAVIDAATEALRSELTASRLYRELARLDAQSPASRRLADFAAMEEDHVRFWTEFLTRRGVVPTLIQGGGVGGFMLARRLLGTGLTLKLLQKGEADSIELYSGLLADPSLDAREKALLTRILEHELVHEEEFIREQSELGGVQSYLKDAVLGLSDGLVETLSITSGLAGVYGDPRAVAVSGLVVGVAGALSMGLSIYTSSRAQRQVHEGILARITSASLYVSGILKERVATRMAGKGYSPETSTRIAEEAARDPEKLTDLIAGEEYGLSEENLGEPARAALFASAANLVGTIVPLLPYFFAQSAGTGLILSFILAAAALAVTGFLVSILGNTPAPRKIAEMVATGLVSAAATYFIGLAANLLLGVAV